MILYPPRIITPFDLFSHLVQSAGNLLRTPNLPYHLSDGCPSHTTPAPCSCPGSLATTYTVSGFGGLSPCPTCDASTDPQWPGTVYQTGRACLWWALSPTFDPYSINGVALDVSYTQILLNTAVSPCRWELYIACASTLFPTKTMWAGQKLTDPNPTGTYTLVSSDCGNTTPTMTVS